MSQIGGSLGSLRDAIENLGDAKSKQKCPECIKLRLQLKKILSQMLFYVSLGDTALDETRTNHHDDTAYHMSLGTDMASSHARFKNRGENSTLPASIAAILRNN